MNRSGPSTEHWGTPQVITLVGDVFCQEIQIVFCGQDNF